MKTKIILPQTEFDWATISSGTYQTKGYFSREYKTRSGLLKGLKSFGLKGTEAYYGMTWHDGAKQYKLTFSWK